MEWIANIFWNAEQRRLRALWRLLIFVITWFVALIIAQMMIGMVVGIVALASGALTLEQLTDTSTINEYIASNPLIMSASQLAQLVITVGAVWLAGRFLDRRKFVDFGFRLNKSWWIDFGFGLFLGAILMAGVFGVEMAAGWVTMTGSFAAPQGMTFILAILLAILNFVLVGFNEELLSRGYQLQNMAEGFNWKVLGPRWAIAIATLLSSAVFGLMHLGNPNADAVSTFNIFLAGILLAMGYILTGELAIPIGLHISWNFFQGNVFGFPVSGTSSNATTFVAIEQSGPKLWTGGAFGPEAGLVGIGAMVVGALLTVLWVYLRRGEVSLHLPLAQAPAVPVRAVVDAEDAASAQS
ncbi:MAG: CPBP family intramembrane metalloprotease [Anaerolineae bacterium]|nr:CPBP family intramembrane metalloprotease [Anaerolineae bacterium]